MPLSSRKHNLRCTPARTTGQFGPQFLLPTLLIGLSLISLLAALITMVNQHFASFNQFGISLVSALGFGLGIYCVYVISRHGRHRVASHGLIMAISFLAARIFIERGFMAPTALLLVVVIIVVASLLLDSKESLIYAIAVSVGLLILSFLHQTNTVRPDTNWLTEPFDVSDAMGYVTIFALVGIVSWMGKRELERSINRLRASERALKVERDNLEEKVLQRTRDLQSAQTKHLQELQHLAQFGRNSALLLHEIANPLTAASLNMELAQSDHPELLSRVQYNLRQLERCVRSARKQLASGYKE